jgi:hypothetical protein
VHKDVLESTAAIVYMRRPHGTASAFAASDRRYVMTAERGKAGFRSLRVRDCQ